MLAQRPDLPDLRMLRQPDARTCPESAQGLGVGCRPALSNDGLDPAPARGRTRNGRGMPFPVRQRRLFVIRATASQPRGVQIWTMPLSVYTVIVPRLALLIAPQQ
jgi:hypothetical protein